MSDPNITALKAVKCGGTGLGPSKGLESLEQPSFHRRVSYSIVARRLMGLFEWVSSFPRLLVEK